MNRFTKQEYRSKLLFTTNTITAIFLVVILVVDKYPQKMYGYFNQKPVQNLSRGFDNKRYREQLDFYTTYTGQKNIVMLGNSRTYKINWVELLGRGDVANRGIGSDITSGFINRLNFVFNLQPEICFIEGSLNDIIRGIPADTTRRNLDVLIDTLIKNKVKPVLTTVTYVTYSYKDSKNLNRKIKQLNREIIKIAAGKKVLVIDLNQRLTANGFLHTQYSTDGVHFTSKAYLIWREEVLKILKSEKI